MPERRRGRCACCALGCLPVLVLLLMPLVLLHTPPPPALPTPAETRRLQARLETTRRQVRAAHQAARAGRRAPITLRFTEQEINGLLETDNQARSILTRAHVTRAWVRIQEGVIQATALRSVGPTDMPITAEVVPEASGGRTPGFRVQSVAFGRLHMPDAAVQHAADRIASAVHEAITSSGIRVDRIRIEPHAIELVGTAR